MGFSFLHLVLNSKPPLQSIDGHLSYQTRHNISLNTQLVSIAERELMNSQ